MVLGRDCCSRKLRVIQVELRLFPVKGKTQVCNLHNLRQELGLHMR